MPRSRTNPQFNQQCLPEALAPWQIGYEHISELGGMRGKSRDSESSPNTYWRVRSFRNYADYALNAARSNAASSCAPKLSGGVATAGSSQTTFWLQASK
jgi:hypothetical protein